MGQEAFDVAFIGPHPDDIEIGCGGTVSKLTSLGKKVILIDLTEGEMSTKGNVSIRYQEASDAQKILGASKRVNLKLKDGQILNTVENRAPIIETIRRNRPKIVFIPYSSCRHPDHANSSVLCYDAIFLSGLKKIENGLDAFRPDRVVYYAIHDDFDASFIVNITEQYENKLRAIHAYKSQFEESAENKTYISGKPFLHSIETRDRYYGNKIGRAYGEAFKIKEDIEVEDPYTFLSSQTKTLNRPLKF